MKKFLDEDFLLQTETAKILYHNYAEKMPIFDYHCHLPVKDIAENIQFKNITQLWLYGDHYKWRLMRSNGIEERYCTGDADDWEKFYAWSKTVPYTIRNPLYHWTHLELKRYFGIENKLLNPETAKEIYDHCNRYIKEQELTPFKIFKKFNIKVICTTDDPTDTLEYHIKLKSDKNCPTKIYPTFRPDKGIAVEDSVLFNKWVDNLSKVTKMEINNFDDYLEGLSSRHNFFHSVGCRISDHALEIPVAEDFNYPMIRNIFKKVRSGEKINNQEIKVFKSYMMIEFAKWDYERDWTMQLHIGAIRNNNTKMFKLLGPDTGFDSIGDSEIAKPLSKFLDKLNTLGKLPKTIIYNINPKDNDVIATMLGNFQDCSIPGKIQYGSAWWFLDNKNGIESQLKSLSNMGLLSRFIGMLTDSRSFMSYPRHEYFRRILCNLLGNEIENGELPADILFIGKIVEDICYNNAVNYFKI